MVQALLCNAQRSATDEAFDDFCERTRRRAGEVRSELPPDERRERKLKKNRTAESESPGSAPSASPASARPPAAPVFAPQLGAAGRVQLPTAPPVAANMAAVAEAVTSLRERVGVLEGRLVSQAEAHRQEVSLCMFGLCGVVVNSGSRWLRF